MRNRRFAGLILAAALLSGPKAWATTYAIDPDHSSVGFKIRHLLSSVRGSFKEYEGTVEYEPGKPESWKAKAVIQAASIDTAVPQRDKHLRSEDFFEAEKYPTIEFAGTRVTDVSGDRAKLHGLLTIHGIQKPVVLDLQVHGVAKDPWGNERAGFTASTKINRKDFGLTWNQALETGQLLVGDEVEITLEVEGLKKTG